MGKIMDWIIDDRHSAVAALLMLGFIILVISFFVAAVWAIATLAFYYPWITGIGSAVAVIAGFWLALWWMIENA